MSHGSGTSSRDNNVRYLYKVGLENVTLEKEKLGRVGVLYLAGFPTKLEKFPPAGYEHGRRKLQLWQQLQLSRQRMDVENDPTLARPVSKVCSASDAERRAARKNPVHVFYIRNQNMKSLRSRIYEKWLLLDLWSNGAQRVSVFSVNNRGQKKINTQVGNHTRCIALRLWHGTRKYVGRTHFALLDVWVWHISQLCIHHHHLPLSRPKWNRY